MTHTKRPLSTALPHPGTQAYEPATTTDQVQWYVMRDLKRSNAKHPAWEMLKEQGIEFFTPMHTRLVNRGSRQVRVEQPYVANLLFVHSTTRVLNPLVKLIPTFQYRYRRSGKYHDCMTVREEDMQRFIHAVENTQKVRYYQPDELTPEMIGKSIRIIGGPLNGYVGHLLSVRGLRSKHLLVELPGHLTAAIEINPDYIEVMNDERMR